MSTEYHPPTDGQSERTNQVREGYIRNFVNYDQNACYQMLLLGEYAYNNSKTRANNLTPFSPTTGSIHRGNGLRKEILKTQGHNVYGLDENSGGKQEDNARAHKKDHGEILDRRATPQPDIEIGDMVMLNARNIKANDRQGSSPHDFTARLKSHRKMARGPLNSISWLAGKSTKYFTSRCSNPIKSLTDPTWNNPNGNQRTSKVIWNGRLKESLKVR